MQRRSERDRLSGGLSGLAHSYEKQRRKVVTRNGQEDASLFNDSGGGRGESESGNCNVEHLASTVNRTTEPIEEVSHVPLKGTLQ